MAGQARLHDRTLTLTGVVASADGATMLRGGASAPDSDAERLGVAVADELLAKGARALLDARGDG
jgi:hydroxymethylbilane synthase